MRVRRCLIGFVLAGLFHCHFLFGQSFKTYRLPAYTSIDKVSWKDSIYWFPKFQEGNLLLANGYSPDLKIKINYNLYWERMEIINDHSDTVSLITANDVRLLNAGGYLFYNDKKVGFVQVLIPGEISLAISCKLNMVLETSGGERFKSQDLFRNTVSRFDRLYQRKFTYFFMNKESKLSKAIKPSILKLMPHHKQEIKDYLKEKPVNFSNQRDLIRLLTFCNSMPAG